MSKKSEEKDLVTFEDLGYMVPPPKEFWPAAGKGIRCGTCARFGQNNSQDIEDMLGSCSLLPLGSKVHAQACCNYQWNAKDKVNPPFPEFPGTEVLKRKLPFYGKEATTSKHTVTTTPR